MLLAKLAAAALLAAPVVPLPIAHAHNDYEHRRPLLDALDCGFGSVEADIWLVDGELLVAHDRAQCRPERTLRSLYLEPLRQQAKAHDGRVLAGGPVETLLIDLKSAGPETYAVLRGQLAEYADLLSAVRDDQLAERAVTVVLSGNCPRTELLADNPRYAGIDGRAADLDSDLPAHAMPLISDTWLGQFRWLGNGDMPEAQRVKLTTMAQRAHQHGRRLRFWATPAVDSLWRELLAAKVDLIGSDDLPRLRDFLLAQPRG